MPRSEQFVVPPVTFFLVSSTTVSTDVTLPAGTRGLLVGTAGSLNVTMTNDDAHDGVPFGAGITPGFFSIVRTGGTAANIWAIL